MGFHFFFYSLIFIYFFKYETNVSRNGLSLGYSERDTSSVNVLFVDFLNRHMIVLGKDIAFIPSSSCYGKNVGSGLIY